MRKYRTLSDCPIVAVLARSQWAHARPHAIARATHAQMRGIRGENDALIGMARILGLPIAHASHAWAAGRDEVIVEQSREHTRALARLAKLARVEGLPRETRTKLSHLRERERLAHSGPEIARQTRLQHRDDMRGTEPAKRAMHARVGDRPSWLVAALDAARAKPGGKQTRSLARTIERMHGLGHSESIAMAKRLLAE